jgi:hypothetical protein
MYARNLRNYAIYLKLICIQNHKKFQRYKKDEFLEYDWTTIDFLIVEKENKKQQEWKGRRINLR